MTRGIDSPEALLSLGFLGTVEVHRGSYAL